MEAAAVL